MHRRLRLSWPIALLALVAPGLAFGSPKDLTWDDLMPEGEFERLEELYAMYMTQLEQQMGTSPLSQASPDMIEEGSRLDEMQQIGTFNTVAELDGAEIRLPGYVVPFDFDAKGKYTEFLLVPYFGACIHSPPPPPNQIVYVKADKPVSIDNIWTPVWVEGELSTEKNLNDLGDAAYSLSLGRVEPY